MVKSHIHVDQCSCFFFNAQGGLWYMTIYSHLLTKGNLVVEGGAMMCCPGTVVKLPAVVVASCHEPCT